MRTRVICISILMLALLPPLASADSLTDDPRVASALRLIEVWVETQLAYEAIPGISMGIVYDQDLIWSKGFGFANPDKQLEATPRTIYSICSISKLFTSVAVMQLRDQGKLSLDEPIETYLPWYRIKDKYPEAPLVDLRGILTLSVPTRDPLDALTKLQYVEEDTFQRVRDDGALGEAFRFERQCHSHVEEQQLLGPRQLEKTVLGMRRQESVPILVGIETDPRSRRILSRS